MTGRWRARTWLAAPCAALLVGCAVDVDDQVREVDPAQVPFELLAPSPSVETTTTTVAPSGVLRTVYLVDGDGLLTPVERRVDAGTPADLVQQLAVEPSGDELEAGYRTSLARADDEPVISGVDVSRGVATIDLAPAFTQLSSDRQLEAIAQLVLTMTAQPGIGQVSFTLDATPVDVPRADGTTTADPVVRADYRDLVAPP